MSAYKSDQHCFYCKLHNYIESVIITFYIEYVMLVAYVVGTVEHSFHISETGPFRLSYLLIPYFEGSLSIWMLSIVFYYSTSGYNSHPCKYFGAKVIIYFEKQNIILEFGTISNGCLL